MKYQLLIIFVLGLSLAPISSRAGAADISGTWAFSVSLDGGSQNFPMAFVFKQQGEKLNGSQTSGSGEPKVTGAVKGNKVEFSVDGKNRSGEPFKNTFTGVIESPIKMSGACGFPNYRKATASPFDQSQPQRTRPLAV